MNTEEYKQYLDAATDQWRWYGQFLVAANVPMTERDWLIAGYVVNEGCNAQLGRTGGSWRVQV